MTELRVTSFWYKCIACGKDTSATQSNPLDIYELLNCFNCGKGQRVMGFKGEPQIEVKEIKKEEKSPYCHDAGCDCGYYEDDTIFDEDKDFEREGVFY